MYIEVLHCKHTDFPEECKDTSKKIIAKTYYDCQNKSWLLHIIAGNKYR